MNDPEKLSEHAVFDWYTYIDKVLSVLIFTAGLTALQFEALSSEIATISLIFLCLLGCGLASDRKIKKHSDRLGRYKGKTYMLFIGLIKSPLFMLTLTFLVCIATGLVTVDSLVGWSLEKWLGFHSV